MIANNYGLSFVHRSIDGKMKSGIEEEDDNRIKEIDFLFKLVISIRIKVLEIINLFVVLCVCRTSA